MDGITAIGFDDSHIGNTKKEAYLLHWCE